MSEGRQDRTGQVGQAGGTGLGRRVMQARHAGMTCRQVMQAIHSGRTCRQVMQARHAGRICRRDMQAGHTRRMNQAGLVGMTCRLDI
jgi:hypothetical protein